MHIIEISPRQIARFSDALSRIGDDSRKLQVIIGGCSLEFELSDHDEYFITGSDNGAHILISAMELKSLQNRLAHLATVIDPENYLHIHLSDTFLSPPVGLSDIVIERINEDSMERAV